MSVCMYVLDILLIWIIDLWRQINEIRIEYLQYDLYMSYIEYIYIYEMMKKLLPLHMASFYKYIINIE